MYPAVCAPSGPTRCHAINLVHVSMVAACMHASGSILAHLAEAAINSTELHSKHTTST